MKKFFILGARKPVKGHRQWLGHLWNHENMFETGVVRANECYSLRQVRYIFSNFLNMKVCCVFSLESPHRGDSNKYTQLYHFQYIHKNHSKLSQMCSYGIFSKGLKNEFERAISVRSTEGLLYLYDHVYFSFYVKSRLVNVFFFSRSQRYLRKSPETEILARLYGTPEGTFPFRYLSEKKLKQEN